MSTQDARCIFSYLTGSQDVENAMMSFKQYMKIGEEHKERNVDPFELQVFQEQVSTNLRHMEDIERKQVEQDTLSRATSNVYKGFNKAKKGVAKKQRDTTALPQYIRENINKVQFGITTLPSDNMNMVMTNEFQHDFVRKVVERQAVEKELQRIANIHQKNAKHNIYMTKGQALRNEATRVSLEKMQNEEIVSAQLEKHLINKMVKNAGSPRAQSSKSPRPMKLMNGAALPPIQTGNNEQE